MENLESYLPILKKSQLFKGLSDTEIQGAVKCLCQDIKVYPKGTTLFYEGDSSALCQIVLSGEIVLSKTDFNGSQNIIARMFPSQILGAASAFSTSHIQPFDMTAASPTLTLPFKTLAITHPCQNACSFHSKIIENLLTVISDNNLILAEKIDILTKRSTRERIMAYLYSQSKKAKNQSFTIGLTRVQLSQYLSVDRCSLSRELKRLQDEGVIEFSTNRFKLK